MALTDVLRQTNAGELRLLRGSVSAIEADGRVRVRLEAAGSPEVSCDVLRTGAEAAAFALNEQVLVACANYAEKSGIILGHVDLQGAPHASQAAPTASVGETRDGLPLNLVVEAVEGLTLKCGEATITIKRDGKVVIRGQHILSHAKGTQRIRGGCVAIN